MNHSCLIVDSGTLHVGDEVRLHSQPACQLQAVSRLKQAWEMERNALPAEAALVFSDRICASSSTIRPCASSAPCTWEMLEPHCGQRECEKVLSGRDCTRDMRGRE